MGRVFILYYVREDETMLVSAVSTDYSRMMICAQRRVRNWRETYHIPAKITVRTHPHGSSAGDQEPMQDWLLHHPDSDEPRVLYTLISYSTI